MERTPAAARLLEKAEGSLRLCSILESLFFTKKKNRIFAKTSCPPPFYSSLFFAMFTLPRRAAGVLLSGGLAVTVGVSFCGTGSFGGSFGGGGDKNSAFVFIKPHANTAAAQDVVK